MPEEIKSINSPPFSPAGLAPETEDGVIIEEIIVDAEDAAAASREGIARSEAHEELAMLREEIRMLRERLTAVGQQTAAVVKAERNFIDASAHAQLGDYPWVKLAGASIAAFMVGKALRSLPFGLIAASLVNAATTNRR